MGGGSGRKTELGKLDHGGRWRDEQEWPLARAQCRRRFYLHGDGSLAPEPPATARSRGASPTTPRTRCRRSAATTARSASSRRQGEGMEPMWMRLLNPALLLRNIMTPGPRRPEGVARRTSPRASRTGGCRSAPDVLVYQTEPLARAGRGDGPRRGRALRSSSSALDTDFTAKLIDVYPPNEDYPDGYDMLINDSIIRCRYRNGFEREELMEPGTRVRGRRSCCRRRRNLFAAGHRIRIDVSSSNFPRLERNPNTGEPIGRHTHMVDAEQTVLRRSRSCCR